MSASKGWWSQAQHWPCCALFFLSKHIVQLYEEELMAKYRMSMVFAFGARVDSMACLIWVIMSTWLLENTRKKGSNAPPVFLCVSCSVCLLCDQRLCRMWHINMHFFQRNPVQRERSSFTLDHRRVKFLWLQFKEWWKWSGCNHWTCRKAKNLQYVYLDLTGVYLLKGSVL